MALHRLTRIEIGVPNVDATRTFYRDFGLEEVAPGQLATRDGGVQLEIVRTPTRCIRSLGVGVEATEDLLRIHSMLERLQIPVERDQARLVTVDPGTDIRVVVSVSERIRPADPAAPAAGEAGVEPTPGNVAVRPRKLSHVVLGSPDAASTQRFLIEGIGFSVSDRLPGMNAAFLRCSADHHNVLVQPGPQTFLHHTAWEVADVDAVGRAATGMLDRDAACHVWGLGRHAVGSNYFWYLRDPAGNFVEYCSDVDQIADGASWQPGEWHGRDQLYRWGPPPPREFLMPSDIFG